MCNVKGYMCPWQRSMEAPGVFEKLRSQGLRDNDC